MKSNNGAETSSQPHNQTHAQPVARSRTVLVTCFVASMFVSAFLLFLVQPMFAKMALPLLGGSSGVWNTAMVFFQTVLLVGYLYAHILSRYFPLRFQVLTHAAVLAIAVIFLPISIPDAWRNPGVETPTLWLLGLFTVALGAPFFALSANAPLLQKWFSNTSHPSAHDPYFLYAASNLGSLISLLGYPIVIEPSLILSDQSSGWALTYIVLIFMIMGCAILALRSSNATGHSDDEIRTDQPVTIKRQLAWVGYALIPSSLMLGVTAHLTTNVASTPFLWVMPLALYLLTFVIAFSRKPVIPQSFVSGTFPFILLGTLILITLNATYFVAELVLNLGCFFLITQMCHNRLAQDRPQAAELTRFYLLMSLGGVIGGAITALAAPLLFNNVYEYHLMVAAAGLVALGAFPKGRAWLREILILLGLVAAVLIYLQYAKSIPLTFRAIALVVLAAALVSGVIASRKLPFRLFAHLAATALLCLNIKYVVSDISERVIYSGRSFFGVSTVAFKQTDDGPLHIFNHGNTQHNKELRSPAARGYPLSYYSPSGPFGEVVRRVRDEKGPIKVAIVGLGAGAMACHEKAGEKWDYYEIDPVVIEMARNPDLFSFMSDCAPNARVVVGDARLTLEKEPNTKFDLIMIDAFSSNVIPAHLVTLEAMELYHSKLKEGGYIFFHTSNRNLDVDSVVLNSAAALGYSTRAKYASKPGVSEPYPDHVTKTSAIMVASHDNQLEKLFTGAEGWKVREGEKIVGTWKDDFSHVIGALISKQRQKSKNQN